MMKRDVRIELFRCLCMMGVVLLHSLEEGGYASAHRGLDDLMRPSVVGFVFISGWFGIRFKWKSAFRLVGVGIGCAITMGLLSGFVGAAEMDASGTLNRIWRILHGGQFWFLWMYLALMMLTPALNGLFDFHASRDEVLKRCVPFLVTIFVWSYAATKIPVLKDCVPSVVGFSPLGVLTFAGVYLAARMCRYLELDNKFGSALLFVMALGSGLFCWIGFMHYNSPFALIFAIAVFLLFKRLPAARAGSIVERIVLWISPSLFSVYLLHCNFVGVAWIKQSEDALVAAGWGYYSMCFLVAGCVFFGCLILDIPRRMICLFVQRLIVKPCHWRGN